MFESGNDFVDYLNSMNNANSSNENALAEAQVLSNYYDYIKIDRKLGNVLYNELFENKPTAVILTGHAGDGKTSILIQILEKIGYFNQGKKPLKEKELVDDKFFYVKDMSELNEDTQKNMLMKFLTYPNSGISSMLVSNTGPLINTFKNILDENSFENLEIKLLDALDKNTLQEINVNINEEECKFIAVNMANVDNTYLVKEIFDNLLQETLWQRCIDCNVKSQCPIAFNYNICSENKDRIVDFIEKMYIWFKENESRLTIRQMLSHLSFAITGNLNCSEINKSIIYKNDILFDYAFPNLLFGYKGTEFIKESFNIKAIKELSKVTLDEHALSMDHKLFVNENFDMFKENIKNILEEKLKRNQQNLGIMSDDATKIRRAFRRFYITTSKVEDEEYDKLIKDVFSEAFNMYYKLINSKTISYIEKNKIKDIVFEGLFKTYVGVYPKDEKMLYLTVKKDLDEIQNVQLILGEVPENDILIKSMPKQCRVKENENKYITKIRFARCKQDIELTFQMLQYFMRISNGEVFTSLNPSFTFGLNNIKVDLLRNYRYDKDCSYEDDPRIKLLVIKKDKVDNLTIIIENGKMEVL